MKILNRILEETITTNLQIGKVLIVFGARRTGKTVLLKQIVKTLEEPYLLLNGEDQQTIKLLENRSITHYKNVLGEKRILIIDEAQKVEQIGQILKLMVDGVDNLKIIATGSSAFDMANRMGEPLTGRKISLQLFPISYQEWKQEEDYMELQAQLGERLVFGSYPELIHLPGRELKVKYLRELVRDYLLKDILEFEGIRYANKVYDLLRLVAFQTGNEVSLSELGTNLNLDKNTVERYLHILTQVFILFKVGGFSRNLRKEIVKNSKWYFYDNGIRNTLIANLNPIEIRNDIGQLWENYIIGERVKFQNYNAMLVNNFFWRTYDQQEIDWIEERSGQLFAYEMKWKPKKKFKIPAAWRKAYPQAIFETIHPENYQTWIS